jgi:hypothetical protein
MYLPQIGTLLCKKYFFYKYIGMQKSWNEISELPAMCMGKKEEFLFFLL